MGEKVIPDSNRIFVTGAAGFIGSHLIRRLLGEGYHVGIQKRETTDTSRIADVIDATAVYDVDIRNGPDVGAAIADFRPDIIIHLVTYYAVEHEPDDIGVMIDTNVRGTVNLLEASTQLNVHHFINTSTCAVYRESGDYLAETDPVDPQNLYALTKLQAEEACSFYSKNYDLNVLTLRLFPPYGPGDHERRLIPFVIRALQRGEAPQLTSGRQKWDFVFVDDIADAFVNAIESFPYPHRHECINIGTGEAPTVREVVEMIREQMGIETPMEWGVVPHRKNEVWFNSADIQKAANLLGWQPETSLQDGIARTINSFTNHL